MTAAPTDPLRVFLIEDDEDEYLLIRSLLAETHFTAYDLEWVATCDAALRQLTPWRHHVCLLDYRPAFRSGLDMLQEIKRGGCDVPVIVLSSHCDYEMEIGALRAGASDCLPKEQITAPLLERAIRYAIERKRTEQRIARGKKQLEYIFDAVPDCIAIIDSDHRFIRVNPAMARMLGKSPRDLIGKTCYRAVHRRSTPPYCPHVQLLKDGMEHSVEIHEPKRQRHILITVKPFYGEGRELIGSIRVARNITLMKQAEQVLRAANTRLEQQVRERTEELNARTLHLEEANAALKALLRQRDEDRREFEQSVLCNLKSGILPYLERLKSIRTSHERIACLHQIESQIDQIASPFIRELTDKYLDLTPRELQVVRLVKEGRGNKEIAQLLNLSENTIKFHRFNVRRKLGLLGRHKNLRTSLASYA